MILDGIELKEKQTPSGTWYYEYGETNLPTVVFLHGNDQKGNGDIWSLPLVLDQGVCARDWVNGGYNAWVYKEVFSLGLRILIPQLPKSQTEWSINYINSFLDHTHTNQPLYLTGWSLGGGGVVRYMAQANKKHKVTCFSAIAPFFSGLTGENVTEPYLFAHSTGDSRAPITNTDNFVAKIPNFNPNQYKKVTGNNHWFYLSEAYGKSDLYNWFLSFVESVPTVTFTSGSIELGSDNNIYANFNGRRIKILY